MKNLCAISMLVLGIAGNVFCQKSRAKYDTLTVLEGVRPPIMVNEFARKSDLYFNEEVKKNLNNLVIDFGNKNRLLIDYQGVKDFELRHNADSLLRSFWQDYSLIRDTLKQNTVRKITYYARNKNVNRKSIINVQYFPQKEVFQFGKETEIVHLQQDTLVLINFDDKATAELAKSANRVFKTFQSQSFLFNLNAIDDVEEILDFNINQAIIEASERIKNERKTVKPWKILGVENDLASQRIRSKVRGNALFDFISFHADLGVGFSEDKIRNSLTFAFDIVSSYHKKGFIVGLQLVITPNKTSEFDYTQTYFTGMTFYKKTKSKPLLRGGVFVGVNSASVFNFINQTQFALERNTNIKIFGWYQLTPLIRIQPELYSYQFKETLSNIPPFGSTKQISFFAKSGLRISFGF